MPWCVRSAGVSEENIRKKHGGLIRRGKTHGAELVSCGVRVEVKLLWSYLGVTSLAAGGMVAG